MTRHGFSQRRTGTRRTFLAILGLIVGAVVWLVVFRPHFLATHARPSPSPFSPPVATARPTGGAPPQSDAAAAPAAVREAPSPAGTQGDFYRYTDDEGVIHLVDDPDAIPARYRQQAQVYRETGGVTRVRVVHDQVLVPVTLRNGGRTVSATLVLDTGCTVTSISAALAERLGIDPARTVPVAARVADGRRVPASRALIDQVTAGPKAKGPLEVAVLSNAGPQELADGLLGMNFLRDFRYQIDTEGQQIRWR